MKALFVVAFAMCGCQDRAAGSVVVFEATSKAEYVPAPEGVQYFGVQTYALDFGMPWGAAAIVGHSDYAGSTIHVLGGDGDGYSLIPVENDLADYVVVGEVGSAGDVDGDGRPDMFIELPVWMNGGVWLEALLLFFSPTMQGMAFSDADVMLLEDLDSSTGYNLYFMGGGAADLSGDGETDYFVHKRHDGDDVVEFYEGSSLAEEGDAAVPFSRLVLAENTVSEPGRTRGNGAAESGAHWAAWTTDGTGDTLHLFSVQMDRDHSIEDASASIDLGRSVSGVLANASIDGHHSGALVYRSAYGTDSWIAGFLGEDQGRDADAFLLQLTRDGVHESMDAEEMVSCGSWVELTEDIGGDGFSDLFVGAARYTDDHGQSHFDDGSVLLVGLEELAEHSLQEHLLAVFLGDKSENQQGFGASFVGTVDLDGSGDSELIVGAPAADGGHGGVYVFRDSWRDEL